MLRMVVVGLGPIGIACANAVASDAGLTLAGLVDVDAAKVGKTLAELPGGLRNSVADSVKVNADLASVLQAGADVAIVTTTSRFDALAPTLRTCIRHKVSVVSSCEPMAFPAYRHPELAAALDAEARAAGVALLGTGVNPGFVMDSLAVVMSSMLVRVDKVRCVRRVDAATRRKPLQAKVGATMTVENFNSLAKRGGIGHAGIGESVALLAAGLGRQVSPGSVQESLEPVIADRPLPSSLGEIQRGQVCGMRNTAAWQGDGLAIELDLTMAVGLANPMDEISFTGPVPLQVRIPGSTPGDSATVAALLNAGRRLKDSRGGLLTMLDLPPLGALGRLRN